MLRCGASGLRHRGAIPVRILDHDDSNVNLIDALVGHDVSCAESSVYVHNMCI